MDGHRVRRIAETLVASQLRSGRNASDPRSFFGRPVSIAIYDAILFVLGLAGAAAILPALALDRASLAAATNSAAPLLPLLAVVVVVLAGVLFELTTTAKFSGSDAANWLPITPTEYVAASAMAIAYTYSLPVAVALGALLPVAIGGAALPLYLLAAGLSVLGLFEGALLVEMVRATTQQSGSASTGGRGAVSLLFRAGMLVVLLLVVDLTFYPTFLQSLLKSFPAFEILTAAIPLFWSTQSVGQWVAGHGAFAAAFALGEVAFVGLLLALAGALRVRYWVPSPAEAAVAGSAPSAGHRWLGALGLSAPEAAIVSKDLRGYVRRREMLPAFVVPTVLVLLLLVEGGSLGRSISLVYGGLAAGFLALLLSTRSVGQERHSLQWLYAYPISVRSILRAKVASVLLPALVGASLLAVVAGVMVQLSPPAILGALLVILSATTVAGLWGLVFAARFSDFQDRPRPQFLRPAPTLGATASGILLVLAILAPADLALVAPSTFSVALLAWAAVLALGAGALSLHWARTGFDQLFYELPF